VKERDTEPDFGKQGGLVPAVAQDASDGTVLMVAWMNREAWQRTLVTGKAHYYSRSRGKLWMKGETSGNIQEVQEVRLYCDADTVLLKVQQRGRAACHTGYRSCFFTKITTDGAVADGEKVFDPEDVYGE